MMHSVLTILSHTSRLIGHVLGYWKLALLAAFFLSGWGPHLRWEYTYRDVYGHRSYISCTYLGPRGFITPQRDDCPFIALLESGPWRMP